MSEDAPRSVPPRAGSGSPLILPSTFSPWRKDDDVNARHQDTMSRHEVYELIRPIRNASGIEEADETFIPSRRTMGLTGGLVSPMAGTFDPLGLPSPLTPQTMASTDQRPFDQANVNFSRPNASRDRVPPSSQIQSSTCGSIPESSTTQVSAGDLQNGADYDRIDGFYSRNAQVPVDCHSRQDVHIKRRSRLYIILIALSLYSTLASGLWLVVSIVQPRFGRGISSGKDAKIAPATATIISTLLAKTIELSFVTVFVAVLGQVLTRRAFSKESKGITLAEMTLRNWVIQPGSVLTYWDTVPLAAPTLLGILTLIATACALLYTTASDALVSPKLMYSAWQTRDLSGLVRASYANPYFVQEACTTPIDASVDASHAQSCLDVQYSGQSYHNLLTFMDEWKKIHDNGISTLHELSQRPTGKHSLFDNTTMESSWIETESGDTKESFSIHGRVINNVTLAMPHPGVYSAATDPTNDILQPNELSGVGEYSIRASVVSPAVNVMCVNLNADELAPLIYTEWPSARFNSTDALDEMASDWLDHVPKASPTGWLNATIVDDVFQWGEKYQRRPPVFPLYPIDWNMITNTTVIDSNSMYLLAKSGKLPDYTLCELRSWVTAKCSTRFDISGTMGSYMKAHCEDATDEDSYINADPAEAAPAIPGYPIIDWRNLADQWRLSMDLNGGVQENNASNARILTHLALSDPQLDPLLPSIAEALAVLASSTLVVGSLKTTYKPTWTHGGNSMMLDAPGVYESFRASIRTQEYAAAHSADWQAAFYPVLFLVFILNALSLFYLIIGGRGSDDDHPTSHSYINNSKSWKKKGSKDREGVGGLLTDYTEPQNLFALAVNSPPSRGLAGSCGGGPDREEMMVPWRIGYGFGANHYYFEEDARNLPPKFSIATSPLTGDSMNPSFTSGSELLPDGNQGRQGQYGNSYKRLSSSRAWI